MVDPDTYSIEPLKNWAGIVGKWHFGDDHVHYLGAERPEWPFGLCVSDIRFWEGEAHATIQQTEITKPIDGGILLGYQSLGTDYYVVGLGGHGRAYSLARWNPAFGWRQLVGVGSLENLQAEESYKLFVRVRGQRLLFQVNGVRIFEHVLPTPLPYGQIGAFAWGDNPGMTFSDLSVKLESQDRGEAFVVMQFSGYEELYADVIEPLAKDFHLRPYRADKIFGPGSIIEDIVRGIETAQVIIAEITPVNANVFYEVGYAHALKKPTILLAKEGTDLPFDIKGYRCLFYKDTIGGKRLVEEGLRKHLQAILNE
jgi:hypothetical protein